MNLPIFWIRFESGWEVQTLNLSINLKQISTEIGPFHQNVFTLQLCENQMYRFWLADLKIQCGWMYVAAHYRKLSYRTWVCIERLNLIHPSLSSYHVFQSMHCSSNNIVNPNEMHLITFYIMNIRWVVYKFRNVATILSPLTFAIIAVNRLETSISSLAVRKLYNDQVENSKQN